MKKTVVLVGLGHCHVQAVRGWNRALDSCWKKIVICPENKVVYSGMVTGCIAGDYELEEACIDVKSVCSYFGWTWVKAAAYEIFPEKQKIRCSTSKGTLFELFYDVLSINVGSRTALLRHVAVDEQVLKSGRILTVRPVGSLLSKLDQLEKQVVEEKGSTDPIVIIGGSYAGVELAFCLESRMKKKGIHNPICIVEYAEDGLRRNFGTLPGILIGNALKERNIRYEDSRHIVAVKDKEILFEDKTSLNYAFIVLCTGAEPPKILEGIQSISKDSQGFIKVLPTLQTLEYSNIFACGDCCSFATGLPKAGVYAVRQGAILAKNISLLCEAYLKNVSKPELYRFCPQRYYLSLLSTGDGRAIGMKYGLACYGRCMWKLKDKIDRDWIDQMHRRP